MSKIGNKKAECGYEDKPLNKMCSNCAHFAFDRVLTQWCIDSNARHGKLGRAIEYTVEKHGVEKNMRCTRNGFAVKKMARCGDWEAKAEKVSA